MEEWHALSSHRALEVLKSSPQGLGSEEAAKRLQEYGPNRIGIKKKTSPLQLFLNQFKSILVALLLLAAFVSLATSIMNPEEADFLDAVFIFIIVLANAIFGFLQEYKAERTIEELTKMAAPLATVIRGGKEVEIASEEVVPGDILLLGEGDKVAADARLVEGFSLYTDESMLTGESLPVHKKPDSLKSQTILAERSSMLYMNSVVTRGKGTAVVVETGLKSEFGKIAKEISEVPDKVTRFQIEIEDIGAKVSTITVAIMAIIAIMEFLLRTGDLLFIFIAVVALGVAAIPEGLPAVVTLSLSVATNRMLKQNALMRRLSTVQDLGAVDVICTDKTGTLTENVMTVTQIYVHGKTYDVKGKGLAISGEISPVPPAGSPEMEMLLRCAILCNDVRELHEGQTLRFKGDPTDIAILIPAYKAGINVDEVRRKFRMIGEVPFSSDRKMMSTVNSDGREAGGTGNAGRKTERTLAFVKGAPEIVLEACTSIMADGKVRRLTDNDRKTILEHNRRMASHALRVIAMAYKESPASLDEKDTETRLTFIGMMGMIDPPREGVLQAIADCRRAGIRVIMITGDNRYTAEAIGRELGFGGQAVGGDELDKMSEEEIRRMVEIADIYARTSPRHKVMLLKALQKNGHAVCMTGDGVNDAAAIKNSDVGIAMGIRGTEVTRQASDITILDDNFITIRNAIAEGRGTFDNIKKFAVYLLGANISEVLIIFLATITALGISPKIAIQLLWINLLTDGLPALALGVDPVHPGIMERQPRKKAQRMMDVNTLYFLILLGLTATIALFALYANAFSQGDSIRAYTLLFTGIVTFEMVTVYLVRWKYGASLLSNKWLHLAVLFSFLLQFAILYTPLGAFFLVIPLTIADWTAIGMALGGYLALIAGALLLEKLMVHYNNNNGKAAA